VDECKPLRDGAYAEASVVIGSALMLASCVGLKLLPPDVAEWQGLTLVHFSACRKLFLCGLVVNLVV
jgi:hypothetical protein